MCITDSVKTNIRSLVPCAGVAANPLAHVFQAVEEPLPLIEYDKWNVIVPEGEFLTRVGATQFLEVLQEVLHAPSFYN